MPVNRILGRGSDRAARVREARRAHRAHRLRLDLTATLLAGLLANPEVVNRAAVRRESEAFYRELVGFAERLAGELIGG